MKRFIFFTCFILIGFLSYSQVSVTNTILKRSNGSLKKENLDEALIRCLYEVSQACTDKGKTNFTTDTLTLELGKKYTYFYNADRIYQDSLFNAFSKTVYLELNGYINTNANPDDIQMQRNQGGRYMEKTASESLRLYKDRKKQEIISIDYDGVLYAFKLTEKIPPQQWVITDDTLTVLGYLCQKAATAFRGRNYTAWFASEIPINDGPWKLYGLPGLILKANTDDNLFTFKAIGLENLHNPVKITMDKDEYIKCNRKEMEKIRNKNRTSSRFHYFKDGSSYVGTRNETWTPVPIELE